MNSFYGYPFGISQDILDHFSIFLKCYNNFLIVETTNYLLGKTFSNLVLYIKLLLRFLIFEFCTGQDLHMDVFEEILRFKGLLLFVKVDIGEIFLLEDLV